MSDTPPVLSVVPELPPERRTIVRIRPVRGWTGFDLGELWRYRDLLFLLAGRDVKLRYKQTALGVAWVIIQPLVAALIFAVIFGNFARLDSQGVPYLLFVFCGLLPWTFFAGVLQRAGGSLIADARLITKVYFPRLLIPLSSALAVLIDLAVGLVVMAALMAIYRFPPPPQLLALPLFLLLAALAAAGTSLWLAALNVRYRDFMYAMPFLIQVWMYASPVVYSASIVPERWRILFALNPLTAVIEGVRWSLLGRGALSPAIVAAGSAVALTLFVSGMAFFRRVEQSFADVI